MMLSSLFPQQKLLLASNNQGKLHELQQMLGLSAVFMAMTLVVFAGYGWFASAMRRHVIARPRVVRRIQRTFSLSYLALGAKLATVER